LLLIDTKRSMKLLLLMMVSMAAVSSIEARSKGHYNHRPMLDRVRGRQSDAFARIGAGHQSASPA